MLKKLQMITTWLRQHLAIREFSTLLCSPSKLMPKFCTNAFEMFNSSNTVHKHSAYPETFIAKLVPKTSPACCSGDHGHDQMMSNIEKWDPSKFGPGLSSHYFPIPDNPSRNLHPPLPFARSLPSPSGDPANIPNIIIGRTKEQIGIKPAITNVFALILTKYF